jgi:hypothetical protein
MIQVEVLDMTEHLNGTLLTVNTCVRRVLDSYSSVCSANDSCRQTSWPYLVLLAALSLLVLVPICSTLLWYLKCVFCALQVSLALL